MDAMITSTDVRRLLEANDDASLHKDDLLKLEFLRLVETLGIDRSERLLAGLRKTLDIPSPGLISDPRR
jgi:hypothetical protein